MKGEKISLRAPEPGDVDLLLQLENDTGLWADSNTLVPFSRYTIEQYVLDPERDIFKYKQVRLIIDLHDQNNNFPAGAADLFDYDPINRRAGVGIAVLPEFRRRNIASEAIKLLIGYSYHTLHLHQLYCHIAEHNHASLQLFQKLGFTITAGKKDWLFRNNSWETEFLLQKFLP